MLKHLATFVVLVLAFTRAGADDGLTPLETQWLNAADPVLTYAEKLGLPLDIIVQPETRPGDVPLAMGFDKNRCKLVFTFRGNKQADDMLKGVASDQTNAVIQAVVAHEIAHCWRHTRGTWRSAPAGFTAPAGHSHNDMQQTRGEEGFADLVALAWIAKNTPEQYGKVHAWLKQFRSQNVVPGSHHDTRTWINLAQNGAAFGKQGTLFEQADVVWNKARKAD